MAEENNLDNEFDDALEPSLGDGTGDIDDDLGFDNLDPDAAAVPSTETPNSPVERLKVVAKTLLSSRRNQIIIGVGLVALIIASIFLFGGMKSLRLPNRWGYRNKQRQRLTVPPL